MTATGGTENYAIGTNSGAPKATCCGPTYTPSDNAVALGKWTDFVMLMTFATTPTGHLTLWRRDEGQSNFSQVVDVANVATLQLAADAGGVAGDHYWKQGLYRGGVARTDVYWLGPTARGTTFAAVEGAAFGTNAGP